MSELTQLHRVDLSQPILIFDGDCGFCTMTVNFMKNWIKPRARVIDWQRAPLAELGVTEEECMTAIQWVRVDGTHISGSVAAAAALKSAPIPWPVLGVAIDLPVLRKAADYAYKWIATNRYRLPGSTPACKIPLPAAA